MLKKTLSLIILIAFAVLNCFAQTKDSTYVSRKDTIAIRPYFDDRRFIDSAIYSWNMNHLGEKPKDNQSFGKAIEFSVDTGRIAFFSNLFYREREVLLPSANYKTFYRFVWLSALRPRHYIITIFDKNDKFYIQTKDLHSKTIEITPLSKRKIKQFERLLNKNHFWQIKPSGSNFGMDGSDWLIEAQKGNRYHFAFKWAPDKESPIRIIGEWLIKHTAIKPDVRQGQIF
ncbi:hypothetical protein KXD93_27355 [Mucilaginibacter sp. BJC16-A38]|uniref:hypothetical protein n=1 Tax=Mucilaginibacter phenanthrenivorans TaxID=1234842 RepID=UPI0021578104|nr:hypothetical protein [Mucilaginibacter phenanthrenivorans]MCR8561401.1 hypothetical protein [Mucilaginibacter phenanthrenivorans]